MIRGPSADDRDGTLLRAPPPPTKVDAEPMDPPMRISFDIDDTIVCPPPTPSEQHVPPWWRWRFDERMRLGTRALLRELAAHRHDLWIDTTSYRSVRHLRGWFGSVGVPISGVVNQARHEREVGRRVPSKLPTAFGIDLHVDDSEGVAEEGRRHGFRVAVVESADPDWAARVLSACGPAS